MSEATRRIHTIDKGQTDYARWSKPQSFADDWRRRSAFAAAVCADSKVVCDIGCGKQALRALLPGHTTYLPADLKQWTEDTLTCDINRKRLPEEYLQRADTVTVLGVLEYIHDPAWFLSALARYSATLVLSYVPAEFRRRRRRWVPRFASSKDGWVNAFTVEEVARLVRNSGFVLLDMKMIHPREILLKARSTAGANGRLP